MHLLQELKRNGQVFIIAVAGDSGSGKTTFTKGIRTIVGEDMVSSFSLDDYHCLDREQRRVQGITPLHPRANRLDLLAEHLRLLRRGLSIDKPIYDHSLGVISGTVPFNPSPVIVIEGLHPFYTQELRDLTDFKIFVDPSRRVKRRWKLRRDVGQRGYDAEEVMKEILLREPDYKLYVDVQKVYADMVIKIEESRLPLPWTEKELERYSVRMIQTILDRPVDPVGFSLDLSKMMGLAEHEFSINFQKDDYYGKRVGVMTLDGEFHQSMIEELQGSLCRLLGVAAPCMPQGRGYINTTELAQLILCWRSVEKMASLVRGK